MSCYTVPTDVPEADGTLSWDRTTLVLVQLTAGNRQGLGYTYADRATAQLARSFLADRVIGRDAMDVPGTWSGLVHAIRNLGRPGIASMAIAAVDNALWDLKAKLLDVSLVKLLGTAREGMPVYGSGGFTSYSDEQLTNQLGAWAAQGIPNVKMKVGAQPHQDLH